MDETQVRLNNFSPYVLAKRGEPNVIIEKDNIDLKTGTTYIGTIAVDPSIRFPLYCIAKGLTQLCEQKYRNVSEEEHKMDHSQLWRHQINCLKFSNTLEFF